MKTKFLLPSLFVLITGWIVPGYAMVYIPWDPEIGDYNSTHGVWDATNRTFILTGDVNDRVQITEDNVTLDGASYSVNGIDIISRADTTIRAVDLYAYGQFTVNIRYSNNTALIDNSIASFRGPYSPGTAIDARYSNGLTFTGNTMSSEGYSVYLSSSRGGVTTIENNAITSGSSNLRLLATNSDSISLVNNVLSNTSTSHGQVVIIHGVAAVDITGNSMLTDNQPYSTYGINMQGNGTVAITDNTISSALPDFV